MQCRRCGFENMPGITTCMRCNSALVGEKINVHPPRAGWRKPFRPFFYALNRTADWLPTLFIPFRIGIEYTKWVHGLILAALSIMPGLGHLISGRWRDMAWLWPAWAASFAGGIYFFGTNLGSFLVGLALALHVWIICDAGKMRDLFATIQGRLLIVFAIWILLVIFFYVPVRNRIERDYVYGVTIPFDLASDQLRKNDFVWFRRHVYDHAKPIRGDLVMFDTQGGVDRNTRVGRQGGRIVGKVLGLPGEHLTTKNGSMTVIAPNGMKTYYNIRASDVLFDIDLTLKDNEYFCLPIGVSFGRGRDNAAAQMISDTYEGMGRLTLDQIMGRGWAVYHPYWEHEWMRHHPVPEVPAPTADPAAAI